VDRELLPLAREDEEVAATAHRHLVQVAGQEPTHVIGHGTLEGEHRTHPGAARRGDHLADDLGGVVRHLDRPLARAERGVPQRVRVELLPERQRRSPGLLVQVGTGAHVQDHVLDLDLEGARLAPKELHAEWSSTGR
jgi:hypothetical protein